MNPRQIQRLVEEGLACQAQGRLAEAAAVFSRLRRDAPRDIAGWQLGGNIALLEGRPAEALELYQRALRLNPRSAVVLTCLGVACLATGDLVGAEAHQRRALRLEPANAGIWSQLATLLHKTGRSSEALECHQRAVALDPKSAPVWHGFGTTLSNLNRSAEALACEQRALGADPSFLPARRGYAVALQKCHRVPEAVHEYEVLLRQDPRQLDVQSQRLFALNYLGEPPPAALFAAHVAYGKLAEAGVPAPDLAPTRDPERKLRVAFFSADFHEHSVAYFLEPILRFIDRGQFEVLVYNFCTKPDAVTARFHELTDLWRDCPSEVAAVVEPIVRADAPDIAIDLGGHTGTSLLPLFARRLAPVQISYLGYPNTTGLTVMDYRFVDAITDPPGDSDRFCTETLVRFAPCAWAYAPSAEAPLPAPPPRLGRGTVTFGSFNNFSKVTDEMLRVWAGLLGAVPGSSLVLKSGGLSDPAVARHARERLRRAGLPDERVAIAGFTATTAEHLAAYAQIDVALDTRPYNGTTTTCEALWMGVPVVTVAGDRHSARVSASLLRSIGRPELIADDLVGYARIARELAGDPARLTSWRVSLREEMRRSVLLDHRGQSALFGAALRDCWQKWCAVMLTR